MPSIFTVYSEVSEVQRVVFNDVINKPEMSFELMYEYESTECFNVHSTDTSIENALNNLGSLCPGVISCVTVTRSVDHILNPSGFVFSIYFNGNDVSNQNIPDPNEGGLTINITTNECAQSLQIVSLRLKL